MVPAKAGRSQLTRVMALEWAKYGIRANAIAPDYMDTPLAAPIWAEADVSRWLMNRVPMKRPGAPAELVGTLPAPRLGGGLVHHRPDVHGRRALVHGGRVSLYDGLPMMEGV